MGACRRFFIVRCLKVVPQKPSPLSGLLFPVVGRGAYAKSNANKMLLTAGPTQRTFVSNVRLAHRLTMGPGFKAGAFGLTLPRLH